MALYQNIYLLDANVILDAILLPNSPSQILVGSRDGISAFATLACLESTVEEAQGKLRKLALLAGKPLTINLWSIVFALRLPILSSKPKTIGGLTTNASDQYLVDQAFAYHASICTKDLKDFKTQVGSVIRVETPRALLDKAGWSLETVFHGFWATRNEGTWHFIGNVMNFSAYSAPQDNWQAFLWDQPGVCSAYILFPSLEFVVSFDDERIVKAKARISADGALFFCVTYRAGDQIHLHQGTGLETNIVTADFGQWLSRGPQVGNVSLCHDRNGENQTSFVCRSCSSLAIFLSKPQGRNKLLKGIASPNQVERFDVSNYF